jgi:hypothetical protein
MKPWLTKQKYAKAGSGIKIAFFKPMKHMCPFHKVLYLFSLTHMRGALFLLRFSRICWKTRRRQAIYFYIVFFDFFSKIFFRKKKSFSSGRGSQSIAQF